MKLAILKNWLIKKPFALQIGEWEDWHEKIKSDNPIKYWIQETATSAITMWWHVHVVRPITTLYWGVMHRYHPNHQYAICKPRTLKPGYHDCDERMLHSVMEEVTNFYETGCNYQEWRESSDDHEHAYNEIERVYLWWTELWPLREERTIWGELIPQFPELPDEWGMLAPLNEKHRNHPLSIEWSRVGSIHWACESEWDAMEGEMLARILKVRKFMWH